MSPAYSIDMPMRRCAIRSGAVAPCFSASVRNCPASSRITSPLNATKFATRKPQGRGQQQWFFGRLPQGFNLFDQQTCSLQSYLGFRRGLPFNVHE